MSTQTARVTSENYFVAVPEWIALSDLSDGAKVLWMVLQQTSSVNRGGGCTVSRKLLADKCGCSKSTVTRRLQELEANGALDVTHDYDEDAQQYRYSTYKVRTRPPVPDDPPSSRVDHGGGGVTDGPGWSTDDSEVQTEKGSDLHPYAYGDGKPSEQQPQWREILSEHLQPLQGKASYDLLAAYRAAGKQIIDNGEVDNHGGLVALTVDYVTRLTGDPPGERVRGMIAKTVARNGLIALAGWDKAIQATEEDSDRDRMAYATAVVNRMITELKEPAHA